MNRCFLCQQCEESVDHLLLYCSKTRVLWELLFSLFGATWIMSGLVRKMLLGWKCAFVGKRRKKVLQVASFACFGHCGRLEIELFSKMIFCSYKN